MTFQSCQNSANKDPRLFSALFLSVHCCLPLLAVEVVAQHTPVSPTITSVSVSCTPVSVQTGQTSQCTATVSGTGSYSSAVTWSAVSGTISSSGLYTAPASVPASGSDTITAKSTQDSTKFGTSLMTVTAAPPTINSVSVSCTPTSVHTGQTSQCTATVSGTGSYSSAVTWSAVSGTISSSGLYTAPASVPASGSDTITAKSTQDSTKFGTSMMTVTAAPPTINSVSVSCTPTSVQTGQTSQCTATVSGTGSYSSAVTWSAVSGTISNLGLYTAPVTVPNLGSDTITATSTQDITKSGSASLAVTTPNPMQHGALVISPPLYASGVSTSMTVSIWIPDTISILSLSQGMRLKRMVSHQFEGPPERLGINGMLRLG